MLNAVVAINGPLGDAVVLTLERATPPWRVRCASNDSEGQADIVIVDEDLVASERRSLLARWTAPVLILGRDLGKPFTVAALRAKALSAARPAIAIDGFVAADRPLRAALEILDVAATRKGGVLIMGPTGVGKERLARRVHERSGRRGPFVALNCAAFNDGLVESALFGHARGAFTGALASVPGALVESHGGTLFLDEVGELDLRVQAKLLRVLEDYAVRALGASSDRRVDTRVVAATNRDLREAAAEGRFRPISTTGWRPSSSRCRRCESARATSPRSSTFSSRATTGVSTCGLTRLRATRSSRTPGRGTCESWAT